MAERYRRNVLMVFLASPGDLEDERRVAKEEVDRLNRIIGPALNWHVELRGWEDTLPGFGRPQELINKDVDSCDLFLGLLWRRWGFTTGVFSSGFEEEFERARKRRAETNCPQIWLLFKKVDTAQLGDPGDQLKLVLTFKETQIASKELLFKEFVDIHDWRQKLYDWLWEHVLNLTKARPEVGESPQSTTPSAPMVEPITLETTSSNNDSESALVSQQLLATIDRTAEIITSGHIDNLSKVADVLDEFQIHRLHLLTATLNSTVHTQELIGTHEINSLYRYRTELKVSNWEEFLLFRTIISDHRSQVCPGWYWFQDMSTDGIGQRLFQLASEDSNENVRVSSLELLESSMIRPTSEAQFQQYKSALLKDRSEKVRMAFIKYLKAVSDTDDGVALELAMNDDDSTVRDEAIKAKLIMIARSNPTDAFSQLLDLRNGISKDFLDEFKNFASTIHEGVLSRALTSKNEQARVFSVRELKARGKLSQEDTDRLREDSSAEIRAIYYQLLVENDRAVDPTAVRNAFRQDSSSQGGLLSLSLFRLKIDPEELLFRVYRGWPKSRLLGLLDWYELDGHLAYKVMALDHFSEQGSRIRDDLKDRFNKFKEQSDALQRTKSGDMAEAVLQAYEEKKLNSFIRAQFTAAALTGLAKNGDASDIVIGREYLSDANDEVALEALRLIERFGDVSDVEASVALAKNKYGALKEMGAIVALKFAPGPHGAAGSLLSTEDSTLVAIVIKAIWDDPIEETEKLLEPLLSSKNDRVRLKALLFFGKKLPQDKLHDFLTNYLNRTSYYYNVVCWLDRILYAPTLLKESFVQELEANLDYRV